MGSLSALDINFLDQPHNSIEAEQAVLGAIFFDSSKIILANEELTTTDFYHKDHRFLFEAMISLYMEGIDIDLVTLVERINKRGQLEAIGGVSYLAKLADSSPTATNIQHYINIVKEKAILRNVVKTCRSIIDKTYESEEGLETVLEFAEKSILQISPHLKGGELTPINDVLFDTYNAITDLAMQEEDITGMATGFVDLDRMTAGFQKSDLIIIAARPSVGKTAFALNIASNTAKFTGENVAIFSLEMGKEQLVNRIISAEGNIDGQKLRTGKLENTDWTALIYSIGNLSNQGLFIDDTPGITVSQIRSKCRRLKQSDGLGMVVIDYLQLISGSSKTNRENRQQEVSEISRSLKMLAKELGVPVIALSQLSRGVEARQDKRPIMSDIRESGSIEQDADVVAFLYRDDYYDKESESKDVIEIIIAKQRNGPVGTVELGFIKEYNKFISLDRYHYEP
ncbi:replicative DNA helicase [Virgibacillus halodenitrificans]|uniref:replicative DNA helicase n=1 Tax=Virgibacillus halodenitrificans TaxID=1482 RepID=UPI000EF4E4E8|nr:replicative DNA helicase [Virgibacillus halodenitrificans]